MYYRQDFQKEIVKTYIVSLGCQHTHSPVLFVSKMSCEHTATSSLLQVGPHAVVVGEHRGCGSDLCSHVTNGGHSYKVKN